MMLRSVSRNWTRGPLKGISQCDCREDWHGILEADGKPVTQRLFSTILSQPAGTYFQVAAKKSVVFASPSDALKRVTSRRMRDRFHVNDYIVLPISSPDGLIKSRHALRSRWFVKLKSSRWDDRESATNSTMRRFRTFARKLTSSRWLGWWR